MHIKYPPRRDINREYFPTQRRRQVRTGVWIHPGRFAVYPALSSSEWQWLRSLCGVHHINGKEVRP